MTSDIQSALRDTLIGALAPNGSPEAHADVAIEGWHAKFLAEWFRVHGKAYFVLFRTSLVTTNIQLVELLSLLRRYVRWPDDSPPPNFMRMREFSELLRTGWEHCSRSRESAETAQSVDAFVRTYGKHIASTVVIDPLSCSCGVFLPPGADVDLALVTARAGYIHSSGRSVFGRNVNKISKRYFEDRVKGYCKRWYSESPVFFAVYCHEDFSEHDNEQRGQLAQGLDLVKIHVEKSYLDQTPLVDVLTALGGGRG